IPNSLTGFALTHLKIWFSGGIMTCVSRNNDDVRKQLGSGQLFGSPHSGGLSSGSPSSVGNSSRGNNF
ncbi:hypothetical protein HID58_066305, partial [Brassica napus]